MPSALFLSPHLDDAAFSCGGLAAILADRGWHTSLVTVFTRSVVPATGFALACQLDKGLGAEVDYMALRRAEDAQAAALLSVSTVRNLDLLEAPHRGYHSAPELFGAVHGDDAVAADLAAILATLPAADLVLVPQGLGNHVDHQQLITAALQSIPNDRLAFYRDTPYAIRQPDAVAFAAVPLAPAAKVDITTGLDRKIGAAQAYASQIGFQFGGPDALAVALRRFALAEGDGVAAERFTGAGLRHLGGLAALAI
jgi:LmbE family N-acetylglucosaminyl deacetylase